MALKLRKISQLRLYYSKVAHGVKARRSTDLLLSSKINTVPLPPEFTKKSGVNYLNIHVQSLKLLIDIDEYPRC